MNGENSSKILLFTLMKAVQRKRSIRINQHLTADSDIFKLLDKRKENLKEFWVSHSNVPNLFLTTNVPRIRSLQKRKRNDNFWWTLKQPVNEECYFEAFRMSKKSFLLLCEKLDPFLRRDCEPCVTLPLPTDKQIAICLYKLASCAEYRVVGDVFGVHKSTVHKYFHLVVSALIQLKNEMIKFPKLEEALIIANEFEKKSCIPNIIGAIDGTHVPVLPPSDGFLDFINRKGWPSIVMQGVVDNNYLFTDVSVKLPGSTHDATVFKESGLFKTPQPVFQYTQNW
ncbi:protein ALP1-like [Bactrocera tryoni]|uniref:protein ALP1-like n=1 Tax=Bactrocera tryoni TaxID=59916 RepID=UPI001A96DB5E|nr:protein ALP1-like [Bactrocera tryoni]